MKLLEKVVLRTKSSIFIRRLYVRCNGSYRITHETLWDDGDHEPEELVLDTACVNGFHAATHTFLAQGYTLVTPFKFGG